MRRRLPPEGGSHEYLLGSWRLLLVLWLPPSDGRTLTAASRARGAYGPVRRESGETHPCRGARRRRRWSEAARRDPRARDAWKEKSRPRGRVLPWRAGFP